MSDLMTSTARKPLTPELSITDAAREIVRLAKNDRGPSGESSSPGPGGWTYVQDVTNEQYRAHPWLIVHTSGVETCGDGGGGLVDRVAIYYHGSPVIDARPGGESWGWRQEFWALYERICGKSLSGSSQ